MATRTDYLARLVERADEAVQGITDAERQRIAFERILDHLLERDGGRQSVDDGVAPTPTEPADAAESDGVFAHAQQRIDAIAEYFKIDPEQVLDVFDVSEEDPSLNIRTGQLPEPNAAATREIALLVTGARTALGRDTDTQDIRQAADDYGKLDSRSYLRTLTSMPEISVLGKCGSSKRIVRMKVRGAEAVEILAQRLLGE